MKEKLSKFNMQTLFYITISIYFFASATTLTMIPSIRVLNKFFQAIRYFCYLIFIISILFHITEGKLLNIKDFLYKLFRYLKQHILLVSVTAVTVISMIASKNKITVILVIVMWACYFYDNKKILECFLISNSLIFIISCICSVFNLLPEVVINRGATIRYSLGYIYPLELMTHFLFLTMVYIYLRKSKYNYMDFIFINIINLLLYKITDARSSFILIVFFSTVSYFIAKNKISFKKIKVVYFYVFLAICSVVPIIFSLAYNPDNALMFKINKILSNRVYLTHNAFNTYGFSLFGKNIPWVGFGGDLNPSSLGNTYNFVDCAYAKSLFDYGIIITVLIILGYAVIYTYSIKKRNDILILIISIILVISIVEPRLFSIELNPYLLMMNKGLLMSNAAIINFFKGKK